ncbi:dihydrolipoamide acetyltransferase family protein [Arthrobacter sulfonylureivorans]|uniref:Dihydrolipoamide acetyltransferase component of pyruvate dehydrogenase complex n=1 Tax=Arthrobacter sulfonylureivorans TaxID=2486855 RepID=A0ABY3W783_9MICC|nr:dihydrolipoamide acetyltransferase family protein [Arthrobacter sulfonylureivorans]UNK46153.1 2-oxo acid dehydrogenase subunit E2 [Arthrobacter sulfonylureivorans]
MSNTQIFNLPDVGEGLVEAEIVSWKVKAGDTVAVNDVIVEIETAKSLVELPSPYAGVVSELLVPEGQTVEVGTPIIAVAPEGAEPAAASPQPTAGAQAAAPAPEQPVPNATPEAGPLVGSGPKADPVRRRLRRGSATSTAGTRTTAGDGSAVPSGKATPPAAMHLPEPQGQAQHVPPVPADDDAAVPGAVPSGHRGEAVQAAVSRLLTRVLAKPPVRKAAKDLGINLADITPTGKGGEVTKQDLLSYQAQREAEQAAAPTFWTPRKGLLDNRIERIPVKGVRKATAKAMVESAFSAPHVSIFVDVDASRTMEFVQRLKKSRDFEGVKVSPLLILAKAVIWAAARNPSVNASWVETESGDEIHVKHFMNLGIAAATPRGLLVPNIKDAQNLSLKELAVSLNELATTARAGKTKPADMQHGTLSITNIGALGIDIGTPIINPGEVAIVAFGTIRQKPWVVSGEVIPRWITTLGGSFDHRVVDGDLSARFMADVAAIMEEPALLLD